MTPYDEESIFDDDFTEEDLEKLEAEAEADFDDYNDDD